jgi:glycine/D-amino acid oxidase-like deaminating enzyme
MDCAVAIRGSGPAALFCALTLLPAVKVQLTPGAPIEETDTLWPGLTEHWGLLKYNLGAGQTAALLQLIQRSRQLLSQEKEVQRGAVLQLASNPTEFQEMTMELRWLTELWPRRLMSAGAASNYVAVNEADGAAFIPDCLKIDENALNVRLLARAQGQGLLVSQKPAQAEIEIETEPQGPGLFTQQGVEFLCPNVGEPWNEALVGIETQRGHLHIRPHPRGWLISGISPEGETHPHFVELLHDLAAKALAPLEGLITEQARTLTHHCSADGLPVAGPMPGNPHKWQLGALAGRSWSLGPALGEQVALALLGQPAPLLEALPCLRPGRFFSR